MKRRTLFYLAGASFASLGVTGCLTWRPDPPDIPDRPGYSDARGRRQTTAAKKDVKTKVVFVLGQSNAISIDEDTSFIPTDGTENFNFYDGRNYIARDPLLGPQAAGRSIHGVPGSSWSTRLGSKLIESGMAERVVLINVAIGATSIGDWAGDILGEKVRHALGSAKSAGLQPDYVLQHQGESDVGTESHIYAAQCRQVVQIFRDQGCHAPYFVSSASYIKGGAHDEVRNGQRMACSDDLGIYPGPDIDQFLGPDFRQDDDLHLSVNGLDAVAVAFLETLRKFEATFA